MRKDDTGGRFVPFASFPTTQWTVVLEARTLAELETNPETRGREVAKAQTALGCLCMRYRPPLLAYLTAAGRTKEDAEDFVQGFLTHISRPDRLCSVDGRHGKFRTWLLSCLDHYVLDQARSPRAIKRGGGTPTEPLNPVTDEVAPGRAVADRRDSPDRAFDRQWALTVLGNAWSRLREDFVRKGKPRWFGLFEPVLYDDEGALRYRDIAREIGRSESGARSAMDRARKVLRHLIWDEIARTLPPPVTPEKVEEELRCLLRLLSRDG